MNYKIQQGDCLELMKGLPDNSVDLILCDLPYGTTACKWDKVIPFEPLWKEYNRISKENTAIILFGSEPFSSLLRISNLKNYRYDIIWHKNRGGGFVTAKKRIMKYHENISIFYKKQPTFNPIFEPYSEGTTKRFKTGDVVNVKKAILENKTNNIQKIKTVETIAFNFEKGKYPSSIKFFKRDVTTNKANLHPTQKPILLLEYLIKTFSNENDIILDNCMGSGSTGVACMNLNRNFIGYELDSEYYKIAENRILNAKNQMEQILV